MSFKIKKIKLNSILALFLSLGLVCSNSVFAFYKKSYKDIFDKLKNENVIMNEETTEDVVENIVEDITEDIDENPIAERIEFTNVSHEGRQTLSGFELWLCRNAGDEINSILSCLRDSRFRSINSMYKIPENCEEFLLSTVNKEMMIKKFGYWGLVCIYNNWELERYFLNLLMEKFRASMAEYNRLYGNQN